MNSSFIMFSNMFSDILFYKHCKWQSLLQCTGVSPIFGSGLSGDPGISFPSVPTRRNLASLPAGSQDIDLHAAPVFPERFKLGLASVGPFS
ncbi:MULTISPECIES: hypothetical protein [Rhizobium]|uniref:hypothetical protein n=1 Tax=Rhizobium TaxID=379 RepID=UPI001AEE2EFF|nr:MULTISPECIES: hypothetical protein [Rhizobium]